MTPQREDVRAPHGTPPSAFRIFTDRLALMIVSRWAVDFRLVLVGLAYTITLMARMTCTCRQFLWPQFTVTRRVLPAVVYSGWPNVS